MQACIYGHICFHPTLIFSISTVPPKLINISHFFFRLVGQIFKIPVQMLLQAYNPFLLTFTYSPAPKCLYYREKLISPFSKKTK